MMTTLRWSRSSHVAQVPGDADGTCSCPGSRAGAGYAAVGAADAAVAADDTGLTTSGGRAGASTTPMTSSATS